MRAWAAAAALALSACAQGDVHLTPDELAARGRTIVMTESVTRAVIPGSEGPHYRFSCLEGWALKRGEARISNVSGPDHSRRSYRIGGGANEWGNGLYVRVTRPEGGETRYVTVAFKLTCVDL